MNTIRQIERINEQELKRISRKGTTSGSWHDDYKHSPYIYVGGLPFELNEGDILSIFSQYGTIVDINLVKEKHNADTRPSSRNKGFAFLAYEDQRSTILAVDNFNGIRVLGRTIRVDHCSNYRFPKQPEKKREDSPDHYEPTPKICVDSTCNKR